MRVSAKLSPVYATPPAMLPAVSALSLLGFMLYLNWAVELAQLVSESHLFQQM